MVRMQSTIEKLDTFCASKYYSGIDPYDFMNSARSFNLKHFSQTRFLMTQLFKLSPLNLRSLFKTKLSEDPKSLSLFIISYCHLYNKTQDKKYLKKSETLLVRLLSSRLGASFFWGSAWDYHIKSLNRKTDPSSVSSSFAGMALVSYYGITKNNSIKQIIKKLINYFEDSMTKNIDFEFYRYRLSSNDFIYNSNSLVLNFLIQARGLGFNLNEGKMLNLLEEILNGLNEEGFWYYNYSTKRIQLDYHQGFIIDMLVEAYNHNFGDRKRLFNAIKKSTSFYKNKQFNSDGVSLYRLPNKWPVDIHNQAQGIITFSKVSDILPEYAEFSKKVVKWTEDNMFDNEGFFYYQMWPFFINKINYMRWSQAWMHLALSQFLHTKIT